MTSVSGEADLLRITTAGSIDDGKSTLIGRLLYDSQAIFDDQLEALERTAQRKGCDGIDLAHLTDGLMAEREQGITIDVATRYFSTKRRNFILTDVPGHEQYTRNMITGASTAELSLILVDARSGMAVQTRRHILLSSLLGIRHLVIAVNKMDLVGYSPEVFESTKAAVTEFCAGLDLEAVHFVPVSALNGANVVRRDDGMQWYEGPALLPLLEKVEIANRAAAQDFRFPVQLVSRPQGVELHDFRGYMGRIESGRVGVGEEIVVLPSGLKSRIKEILVDGRKVDRAVAPQSVILTVDDHIDIARGELIAHSKAPPRVGNRIDAVLCWLSDRPLTIDRKYLLKHATRTVHAKVSQLHYKVDVNTLQRNSSDDGLQSNEIGSVTIHLQAPVAYDTYKENRATGAFIVIDSDTNATVAAGMISADE